jgi:hypothetical protein
LALNVSDVLAVAKIGNLRTLLIDGTTDDSVNLSDLVDGSTDHSAHEWTKGGLTTISGVNYDVYTDSSNADLQVLINQQIAANHIMLN